MLLVALAAAVVVALFTAVLPVLRRTGNRDVRLALPLVPAELANAHAQVLAHDDAGARRVADDLVVDTAVVLAGRPAKGGAQRRFVHARTDALLALAAELQERHDVLTAARAEVDELSGIDDEPSATPTEPDARLAKVVFVVLLPAFLAWDGTRALVDGTSLRLRATGRVIAQAARRWRVVRAAVVEATRQARRRFIATRLRARAGEHRSLRRNARRA
jgi:hypothetical protein